MVDPEKLNLTLSDNPTKEEISTWMDWFAHEIDRATTKSLIALFGSKDNHDKVKLKLKLEYDRLLPIYKKLTGKDYSTEEIDQRKATLAIEDARIENITNEKIATGEFLVVK